MRVVLDANVIVSALFGRTPQAAVLRALEEDLFISDEIVAELVGLRDKLVKRIPPADLRRWTDTFLPAIIGQAHLISCKHAVRVCRDPKDDAYLSLAAEVTADYLVTGDKDLLIIQPKDLEHWHLDALLIVNPGDFLKAMIVYNIFCKKKESHDISINNFLRKEKHHGPT